MRQPSKSFSQRGHLLLPVQGKSTCSAAERVSGGRSSSLRSALPAPGLQTLLGSIPRSARQRAASAGASRPEGQRAAGGLCVPARWRSRPQTRDPRLLSIALLSPGMRSPASDLYQFQQDENWLLLLMYINYLSGVTVITNSE